MTKADISLLVAAKLALASKRGCPAMSRDALHCNCWHCMLYRAIDEKEKEDDDKDDGLTGMMMAECL